jgi:hypothetical protein
LKSWGRMDSKCLTDAGSLCNKALVLRDTIRGTVHGGQLRNISGITGRYESMCLKKNLPCCHTVHEKPDLDNPGIEYALVQCEGLPADLWNVLTLS